MTGSIIYLLIHYYFAVSLSSYNSFEQYFWKWPMFSRKCPKLDLEICLNVEMMLRKRETGINSFFILEWINDIWAGTKYFLQDCACVRRRLRSACASAQADPSRRRTPWITKDPKRLQVDSEDWSAYADTQISSMTLTSMHKQSVENAVHWHINRTQPFNPITF